MLFEFQKKLIEQTLDYQNVAYYLDCGLGKTFVGTEKMKLIGNNVNLLVCQKSKVLDWVNHLSEHYNGIVFDLTDKAQYKNFVESFQRPSRRFVGIINYDLIYRRRELNDLCEFTLMLDESSMIQNESAKRSKYIMRMHYSNLILLSGTPCNGRYENLYSQLKMLGMKLTKTEYWNKFLRYRVDMFQGFPIKIVYGYKNVPLLKSMMRDLGCVFMKTSEAVTLPDIVDSNILVNGTKAYETFRKDRIVTVDERELVGDTTLKKLLYERMLCGSYNDSKFKALEDYLNSTYDRVLIFYNFNDEYDKLIHVCKKCGRPISTVNGGTMSLSNYESFENSVTLLQYQAGAHGLNLQKSNRVVFFSPPLSYELFEQAKKRAHRIGQRKTVFYIYLRCRCSVEASIYATLEKRHDYTEELFRKQEMKKKA